MNSNSHLPPASNRTFNLATIVPLVLLGSLTALLTLSAGCAERVDEALIGHRTSLLKDAEPKNFTTIETAQKNIEQSSSITIQGRADLKAMASEKPRASFLVREVLEDDEEHGGSGHDPSTCPFCKRRLAAAPKAFVVFVDEQGEVIPYDVDKLFSIEHGDVVVVEGQGTLDTTLDLFRVIASSVYVRHQ